MKTENDSTKSKLNHCFFLSLDDYLLLHKKKKDDYLLIVQKKKDVLYL